MTAWVLSGGGFRGAYQLGVLKQLIDSGQTPNIMYGTSAGALNSAALSYLSIDELIDQWTSIKSKTEVLSFNLSMLLLKASGIYSLSPLRKNFLEKVIIGQPKFETKVCRVDLNSGEKQFISNYEVDRISFIDAVIDSSTIPLAMSPRDHYVDGGVREWIPLEVAVNEGATDISAILCTPLSKNPEPWDYEKVPSFLKFFHIAYRAVDGIMDQEIKWDDMTSILSKIENINIKPTKTKNIIKKIEPISK